MTSVRCGSTARPQKPYHGIDAILLSLATERMQRDGLRDRHSIEQGI